MIVFTLLSGFLKTRTGAVLAAFVVACLALFTWHTFDKSSAVRAAVALIVADVELAAAEAELTALKARNDVLRQVNRDFQVQLSESEALRTRQALELDEYETTVDAVVDEPLLGRLSNR
ncbi:hypothetical protein LP7551_02052 [Roseibium album]|nr:hypothetical protein LP7551_02052 [Roseibium album]